jgi:hypothetical protein
MQRFVKGIQRDRRIFSHRGDDVTDISAYRVAGERGGDCEGEIFEELAGGACLWQIGRPRHQEDP